MGDVGAAGRQAGRGKHEKTCNGCIFQSPVHSDSPAQDDRTHDMPTSCQSKGKAPVYGSCMTRARPPMPGVRESFPVPASGRPYPTTRRRRKSHGAIRRPDHRCGTERQERRHGAAPRNRGPRVPVLPRRAGTGRERTGFGQGHLPLPLEASPGDQGQHPGGEGL